MVIPPCADPARRARLEADDEAWLMWYYAPESGVRDPFTYTFTPQQRAMVQACGHLFRFGGDQALIASRGEGKTTIAERMATKATLEGLQPFIPLFGATGAHAEDILDAIRTAIETNDRLAADYPEACVPVRALENTPSRAHYMTASGVGHLDQKPFDQVPIKFKWCGQELIFPNVPGSPSAQAILATRGLDQAVRGLKKKGRRPTAAIIDDPDTEETQRNPEQAAKLEDRIEGPIALLGGQKQPCARLLLGTIGSRTSVAAKFADPQQKPSWNPKVYSFLVNPPARKDLVDEYVALRVADWHDYQTGKSTDRYGRRSHAYWLSIEPQLADAEVANAHRFDGRLLPDGTQVEVSALEHYYNEVARLGPEKVATELDNKPPADETTKRLVLTSYHICNLCLTGLDERQVPEGTIAITAGADPQKLGLHYVVIAWNEAGAGAIIWYDFFEFAGTEGRPAADCERLILEGLFRWYEAQQELPYLGPDGPTDGDLHLIDSGWKEESWTAQPVYAFSNQVGFAKYLPSKGVSPYRRPRDSRRTIIGDNWHMGFPGGVPVVEASADHWKLKVQEGFLAEPSAPGSLGLFDPPRIEGRPNRTRHLSYSKHILAETWETRAVAGFRGARTGFWKSPKPNHYLDATALAIAARSVWGISTLAGPGFRGQGPGQEPAAPAGGRPTSGEPHSRPRW